jgi:hypothetical protein
MTESTLVVLAAGIGSRYGGLKQIEPVGPHGELIVDYSIFDALRAGFGRVVFVIKQDLERAFRQRVGRKVEKHCETAYVFQNLADLPAGFAVSPARTKPWGTAHATLSCREVVRTPFAVINADDFYGPSAYQALIHHLRDARDDNGLYDYGMVGYLLENTLSEHGHVARGICTVDRDGYLTDIHERTRIVKFGEGARYSEDGEHWIELPRSTTVSMNMWGFTPNLFPELEARFHRFLLQNRTNLETAEFFLPEVVGDLIREGRATVKVLPSSERWFGVTYPQDKPMVEGAIRDLIRRGVYPDDLWKEGA